MKCEYCNNEHNGLYGSGRFCNVKCARGFSTKNNRDEINAKVSKTVKEKRKNGLDYTRHLQTPEARAKRNKTMLERYGTKGYIKAHSDKGRQTSIKKRELYFNTAPFEDLSWQLKRKKLLIECNHTCTNCNNNLWLDQPITLEIDHIDGNRHNNCRENLRVLCPNCHAQTTTYKGRNKPQQTNIAADKIITEYNKTTSIHQSLKNLNVNPTAGNFYRAKLIIEKYLKTL